MGVEEEGYDRTEYAELLASLRDELGADEWRLLHLRFVADWTQERIGESLGVSQMTVSRRQRAALQRLHERIARDAALMAELGLDRRPLLAAGGV